MSKSNNFLNSEYPECSYPGCGRQGQKRSGLCTSHRAQQRRGEPLKDLPLTRREIMEKFGGICQLEYCSEEVWVKGYCKYHYSQYQRGGNFTPKPASASRAKLCTFPGCDRLQHSKGHCSSHASQRRKGRELTPLPERRMTTKCSFEGCGLEIRTRGMCAAHYSQWYRTGTLKPLRTYYTPGTPCRVTWCTSPADHRGLCKSHRRAVEKYGLNEDRLVNLVSKNRCDICGAPPGEKKLHIDHDHRCCSQGTSCGECVRGVLCSDCNLSLGKMSDDPDRLRKAAEYLEGNR